MHALETLSSVSVAHPLGALPIAPWSLSEVIWKFSGQFLYTPSVPASSTCLSLPKAFLQLQEWDQPTCGARWKIQGVKSPRSKLNQQGMGLVVK